MEFFTNVQRVGNKIWLRYSKDGKDIYTWVNDFEPTLYVKTKEKTVHKTIFGESLKEMPTEGIAHAREIIKSYDGVKGFELYGNPNWEYSYIFERFGNRCKFDPENIHCAFIDIETTVGEHSTGFPYPFKALEEITLITHYYRGEYHIFSWRDFDIESHNTIDLNTFKHVFKNEDEMLAGYLKYWVGNYPHAVTGWNVETFDIPYIINRIRQRLGDDQAKKLSPINQVSLSFMEEDPTQLHRVQIRGIEILDYLPMFKKYSPGERDFSLDAMSEDFLGENKVENPTGGSFRDFYTGNFEFSGKPENEIQTMALRRTHLRTVGAPQNSDSEYYKLNKEIVQRCWDMFVWYNVRDVDLVRRLDMKLGMLNLTYAISYLIGMNYSDVFGTVKPWDIFLQNETKKKGLFISVTETRGVMPRPLMGGFVHLYKAGLYKDGVTVDATSLN